MKSPLSYLLPLFVFALAVPFSAALGQNPQAYSRRTALAVFAEYSNTSSHIFLGVAPGRKLAAVGGTYSRRLLYTRYAAWHYDLELRPVTFLRNPSVEAALTGLISGGVAIPPIRVDELLPTPCTSSTSTYLPDPLQGTSGFTITQVCGTRWTYAGGVSPLGQRINFAPRHRLQGFAVGNGGFMVATREVPAERAARFNFTFEFGGGVEWFRDHRHAWALEYRLHHLSNAYRGQINPGIDSQVVKVTYSFGR